MNETFWERFPKMAPLSCIEMKGRTQARIARETRGLADRMAKQPEPRKSALDELFKMRRERDDTLCANAITTPSYLHTCERADYPRPPCQSGETGTPRLAHIDGRRHRANMHGRREFGMIDDDVQCRQSAMQNLLSKLTGEQAFDVLQRLAAGKGAVAEAVLAEARRVLAAVDVDEIANEVFAQLDGIDVQDCWDRAGRHRGGYTAPEEAAEQLIEDVFQPFVDQVERYHSMGMAKQEQDYCMGVILGTYRYEKESKSEFKDWCVDMPAECAGCLLDEWRKRNRAASAITAMDAFIRQRCPDWAKYMT